MKKLLFALMLMGIILSAASEVLAVSHAAISAKWERLNESIMRLAEQIAQNNKPAFETRLTKKERSYDDDYFGTGMTTAVFSRIWAKDKTIVSGWANADKNFHAEFIATTDPLMNFAGGIRVGANVKVLEKFFHASLNEIREKDVNGNYIHGNNIVYGGSESDSDLWCVYISYKNGVITEINAMNKAWPGGFLVPFPSRVEAFYKKMRRQLGFPKSVTPWQGWGFSYYYDLER